MNKQGFISNILLLFVYFFLIVVAITGMTIQANPKSDFTNISNVLEWKELSSSKEYKNDTLVIITYDFVNFLGRNIFTITKEGIKYASEHPETKWRMIITILLFSILAPIIYYMSLFLIIVFILIKDILQSKRERIRIKKLEDKRVIP